MKISDILSRKGQHVITTTPDRTVLDAMRILVQHNIGAVLVVEDGEVRGILTERDVLRLGAADPVILSTMRVRDAMTTELVVAVPDDAVEYAAGVMTANRIRHLPILTAEDLVGMVSIGDVVNAMKREMEVENRYLRDYIRGSVR